MTDRYTVYRYDHLETPAVTAGESAVLIGAENGLFPPMGCALPGRMGGLWSGEKKICEGFYLAIDDVPLRVCDAYETNPAVSAFHYRMQKEALHVVRRQMIPDGIQGVMIELTIENLRNAPRMAEISFTVRTDILTAEAWRAQELGRDVAEFDERVQAFFARESRNPWHAAWGAERGCRVLASDLPGTVYGFETAEGKGVNGRAFYRLRIGAHAQETMRLFIVGGYETRTKAENALEALRRSAGELRPGREERIEALMREGSVSLPEERIARCWNWAKVYDEWMTRRLAETGCALGVDLPEQKTLFGKKWTQAVGALLPLGCWKQAEEMIESMRVLCERTPLPAGRIALEAAADGSCVKAGGPAESARFVSLIHRTLLWSGDAEFAARMLPYAGLCMNYIRRVTKGFSSVPEEMTGDIRAALSGYAYILSMTGADASAWLRELASLGDAPEETLSADAGLGEAALWHARRDHVEQMIGCLTQMAKASLPGLPGALRDEDAGPGAFMTSAAAAQVVWPLAEGLFGIRPEAARKTLVFAPHTPIGWNGWKLERLMIGSARFDLQSERVSPSQARYTLRADEPDWVVEVTRDGEKQRIELSGELSLVLGD